MGIGFQTKVKDFRELVTFISLDLRRDHELTTVQSKLLRI